MKRKYPGLSKTFYKGYSEMNDEDFFGIADEDLSSLNLADRVNLWFKVGNYVNIPIKNDEEKDIIKQIANAETFDDALYALRFSTCIVKNLKRLRKRLRVRITLK